MIAIIGRNYKVRGKPKIRNTYFRKIGEKNGVSLLEVLIEKGIRHQIRVHLASPGIPIIGDKLYGKNRTQSIQRSVPDSESLHLFSAGIYSKEGDIQ
ncbi:MAG TPA: RNA pseudouridine synthase [bacterium]|nr:RNA pseudouridine synthase [bacterium]